mgnify:CR=1 FL=1
MAELVSDAPGAAEKSKETFEPPMSLAQSVFRHGRNPTPASEKEILDLVTQRQMAPYYARVCAAFGISKDESLYAKMADANAAEIEIMIADVSARRKGLASEALRLMQGYAMENLDVSRFIAKIGFDNEKSRRLFEGLGFAERSSSEVFRETTFVCAPGENARVARAIEEVWSAASRGTYDEP